MKITYAWRGRGDSYTVRMQTIDGRPLGDTVDALRDQIIRFEHGGQLEIVTNRSRAEYLKTEFGIADNSLAALRAELLRRNHDLVESMATVDPKFAKKLDPDSLTDNAIRRLKGKRTVTTRTPIPFDEIRPQEL